MARPKKDEAPDLSQRVALTAGHIERLKCPDGKGQAFLRDSEAPSLRVRVTAAGAKSFVFEAKLRGKTIRTTIGAVQSWTIEAARAEARRLSVTVDCGIDPREQLREAIEAENRERDARKRAEHFTLRRLLTDYADYLQAQGKPSHRDARSIFKNHVFIPWPTTCKMAACIVTHHEVAMFMRKAMDKGHSRTANKLRSFMMAAFQLAITASSNPKTPLCFHGYGVTSNPAAATVPDDSANQPDKNPLSLQELRSYWQAIKDLEGIRGAALRLHLLTGGQRIEQLVTLKTAKVAETEITLFDGKGRPGKPPRPHTVPLISLAAEALREFKPSKEYALSTTGGDTHLAASTLSAWAKDAAPSEIAGFQAKRIRSGVETALAAARISKDVRGRLQSHGITGVQDRHYDGHEYLDEKRHALEVLFGLLDSPAQSNVTPLIAA
ncbi:tyrosine-type recombinase/integrase [Ralstonia solanacearum]|uniref:tyrosine-type recombinase/integrase n=1 Tax=Ralstonia solanacearum TaxID=305 RepID=UPI003516D4F8